MNNIQTPEKVAIVTGSSSGIGLETAIHLSKNGFKTYATMRNLGKSEAIKSRSENLPIEILQLDVIDDASVHEAIQEVIRKEGRIDLLVNNAGYALMGAAEDLGIDEVQKQFDTNFYGIIRTIKEVLPTMRKQKSGSIVNISSAIGFGGMPLMSAYASTKFAMEGYTESLKAEVAPFGIHAILVEPGVIKTDVISASPFAKKALEPTSAYSELTQKMGEIMKSLYENCSSPSVVAEVVLKAATSDNPQTRYQAGPDSEMLFKERRQKSDEEYEKLLQGFFLPPVAEVK
jgi:NAD(P)-dependent dehydrogenase (short-subunit alcohol dehydrogenase family)